jgi:glycosyltransferase involved in cell wall biosynthesis
VSGSPTLRFVVPEGIDDPARVSGGNVYDRRVRDGLAATGWTVTMVEVAGGAAATAALADAADDSTTLVDGLVAAWAPEAVASAAARSRVVVLAHMVTEAFADADPASIEGERRALGHAARVIATSTWTAAELVRRRIVPEQRLSVALPGAVDGPISRGEAGAWLCVGAVAPHKGQDILLEALEQLDGVGRVDLQQWSCTVAGSREVAPEFADRIATAAERFGSRVRLTGVLAEPDLAAAYQRSGLLVAPSRTESFGMAIADARSRGLPVIAAAVGGIPEAVAGGGAVLVDADDPEALASALERWMTDPALRARLRGEAAAARARAPRWDTTVSRIDRVLRAA